MVTVQVPFASTAPAAASSVAGGAAGLTNATSGVFIAPTTNYNATGGTNGFTTTGVTALVGIPTCAVATRASVCGLRVDPSGTVEFETSSQRGTLGFELFQTEDPTGRRGRLRLTDRALVSPVPAPGHRSSMRGDEPITAPSSSSGMRSWRSAIGLPAWRRAAHREQSTSAERPACGLRLEAAFRGGC
jgi:hypothetical protein